MDLEELRRLASSERYMAVVATTRADGSVQASVVNAGVVPHPSSGEEVVAFVTYGRAKLANLRARPRATLVFRSGWSWAAVEGPTEIVGPDDLPPGFGATDVPALLRDVFSAAGGTHDDWATFDRVMAEERRAAVLVQPERLYSNPARD